MNVIVSMLKDMPRCLLLVLRNINIVRSINKELGVPINRFNYMARYSLRGLEQGHAVCHVY
jgi:aarF domain-containing kinase